MVNLILLLPKESFANDFPAVPDKKKVNCVSSQWFEETELNTKLFIIVKRTTWPSSSSRCCGW